MTEEQETNCSTKIQDVINNMNSQDFDAAMVKMENEIHEEIATESPLLGNLQSLSELSKEYSSDDNSYQDKIKALSKTYKYVRKTRGDGNCFFRAFGFGYLEYLMKNNEAFEKFKEKSAKTFTKLMELGYPTFTVEDFYDNFMQTVESVNDNELEVEDLVKTFCDDGISNYFIVYLRLITSCQIQNEAVFYQNFLDGGKTIVEFCKTEVEPMYKESDHIHIIALTTALEANIRVVYIDHTNESSIIHDFPNGCTPAIHLLYRPGHYDLLYPM